MKRKIYSELLEWKSRSNGSTALLVEGARGVGKSYIIEEFARNEYESYMMIDFGKAGSDVKDVFDDFTDVSMALQKLSSVMRVKLTERRSLVVFEDVQLFPRARSMIKHLVADGRYDYVETGSLVSAYENIKDILVPSEECRVEMFPMDFEEFCWALGDEVTVPLVREHFESGTPLGETLHRSVLEQFRKYVTVGGMPSAVKTYARNGDFHEAEAEKMRILESYRELISKRPRTRIAPTSKLLDTIPTELSRRNKVLKVSDVDRKGGRRTRIDEPVQWMEDSMIVNTCYDVTVPTVAPCFNEWRSAMKMYLGDTGLLVTMTVSEDQERGFDVYANLLTGDMNIFNGMFIENVTAQMLRAGGRRLLFHSFYDESRNRHEAQFLVRDGRRVRPVQIGSGNYASHKSLDALMRSNPKVLAHPTVIYTRDLKVEKGVIFMPVYMAMFL